MFLAILRASTSIRKSSSRFSISSSLETGALSSGLGPNQICTLFGAVSGQTTVSGRDYIRVGYGLDVANLWRCNFVVLVAFALFFQITQVVLIELFPKFGSGSAVTIFARVDSETKKLNERLQERKACKAQRKVVGGEKIADDQGCACCLNDVINPS